MTLPRAAALSSFFLSAFVFVSAQQPPRAPVDVSIPTDVREKAARDDRVRVIVELKLPLGAHNPEGNLPDSAAVVSQRQAIANIGNRVITRLGLRAQSVIRRYQTVPYLTLDVARAELETLGTFDSDVVRVVGDDVVRPVLVDSVPLIQGDQVWQGGYDGTGTIVAVVDTGVDAFHPFLAGKVVEEACYSSTVAGTSTSVCPNGLDEQIGAGAAAPCAMPDCIHGTHVAGIAAGNGATGGQPFSGVAKNAQIMAVQVASTITDAESCGGFPPCTGAFTSDIIAALERVYLVAASHNIAAVNLSLGGGSFTQPCDNSPYKPAIDNLRAIGIASVIASGNSGSSWSIASPACVSSAVSVGSTNKADSVSWYSDVASFLSLLAPGESILSSVPGAGFSVQSGTSMAAPHVTGGWALIRQGAPAASVSTILNALRNTGRPVDDNRFFGTATIPRVNFYEALATLVPLLNPAPTITSLSPSSVRAGLGPNVITVSGGSFNAFSTGRWNGQPRPTRVVSTSKLEITISALDVPSVGTGEISVFTPAPGGGTSSSLTLSIFPPPALAVSGTLVGSGTELTVTLTNGFGGASDWLAFAATGSPDSSYLTWTYVGAGVTQRTWTVTTPSTSGVYEFRLFLNNGHTRVATSMAVTVDASLNPTPTLLSLSPSSGFVGSGPFTLSVSGGGFTASSLVRWNGTDRPTTFVSSTQLRAAIPGSDLGAAGTALVTVFSPAPGGGTTAALPFSITIGPNLAVNAIKVGSGTTVTVTLTNGLGGSSDWLALAATTAPNSSYLKWTYVGAGLTTRTWSVTMPAEAGLYEFRLFLNNGFTRAATSPAVTVDLSLNPPPAIASLSPSSVFSGNGPFTLTVNGTGFTAASSVRWNGADRPTTFVSGTQLRAAIPGSDVAAAGTAQVSVFSPPPGGGLSTASAFSILVGPTLAVNAGTVAPGSQVTVTLNNGLGGSSDWLALSTTTAANGSYVQWTYVGAGVTTRTWTVSMPSTAGAYEFRLYLNNGPTRAATSASVTVNTSLNLAPSVSGIFPSSGFTGDAAFTLAVNGTGFSTGSIVRWNGADRATTFVSSTQLRAAIPSTDLASAGTAQVGVFSPPPGGGFSSTLPFTVVAAPNLAVSATSAGPGASVTLTLTNGLGGSADWLALAAVGSPNSSYLQWTYVGAGVTARTWTVKMPTTAGTYEFRYFINNGYTRAASSVAISVAPGS